MLSEVELLDASDCTMTQVAASAHESQVPKQLSKAIFLKVDVVNVIFSIFKFISVILSLLSINHDFCELYLFFIK